MAYINPDKWMTLDAVQGNPLKGKPKEIREDFYTDLSDTTFYGSSKASSYMIYRFDTAGNLIYRELGDGNHSYGKHTFAYTDDGLQYKVNYSRLPDMPEQPPTEVVSKRIGSNKFKMTHYVDNKPDYYELVTYLDEGRKIVTERWMGDSLVETTIAEYNKWGVEKISATENHISSETMYHFSQKGLLDQIVGYIRSKPGGEVDSNKSTFMNSGYGDPIFEIDSYPRGIDTTRYKYQYDKHGNWIKKLSFRSDRFSFPAGKFPGWMLTVREIIYHNK